VPFAALSAVQAGGNELQSAPLIYRRTWHKGTFFWDGAAGTWFRVDPTKDVIFIGMIQRMLGPASPNLEFESRAVVYGALVDPAK
jgi:CubicO group peptidase (beta-lactamase class C family)